MVRGGEAGRHNSSNFQLSTGSYIYGSNSRFAVTWISSLINPRELLTFPPPPPCRITPQRCRNYERSARVRAFARYQTRTGHKSWHAYAHPSYRSEKVCDVIIALAGFSLIRERVTRVYARTSAMGLSERETKRKRKRDVSRKETMLKTTQTKQMHKLRFPPSWRWMNRWMNQANRPALARVLFANTVERVAHSREPIPKASPRVSHYRALAISGRNRIMRLFVFLARSALRAR